MKIGPLRLERGTASAYLAFGDSGMDVVMEADDDRGLVALAQRNTRDVLVCEPSLSRAAARRGMTVAAPPPVALSMKAALAVNLDHGHAMAQVSPELVLELIEATLDFDAAAPWDSFEPDEAITVRIEPGDRELEGCVLGQAGEEFGLALYHQVGSIQKVIDFADEGRPERARSLAATTLLIERDDAFVVDAIEEMTGVPAAPRLLQIMRGKMSPASVRDVAGVIAALRAVTALATGEGTARGESLGSGSVVVAHASRGTPSQTQTIASYESVGRNEPCPCGSGKKFKRCHLGVMNAPQSDSPAASLHQRDERVVKDVLAFGARRFGADAIVRASEQKFGDRGAPFQLMSPLVAYELPFDGKPLAAHFLEAAPRGMNTDERTWLERQLQVRLSLWEVLAVERGKGVEVIDLLSGQRCFVDEKLGSQTLLPRQGVLGRLVRGERNVFCGMHDQPLGPTEADEVVQSVRRGAVSTGRLIEAWHEAIEKLERKAKMPMILRNTDGHDAATVEDHFSISRGKFQRVVQTLAALDGVLVDENRAKSARLTFTRRGNAIHRSWENTVIGTARLTPTRLVVTTNSLERAEVLAQSLRVELAGLATWKKREREELPAGFGGETIMMDAQATQAASVVAVFRGWLDSPSPQLDNRTPRDAVEDEAGRQIVHVMLKDLEYRHARQPVDGVDPLQWRRELGLDPLGLPLAHQELERSIGAGRKLTDTVLDFARPMIDALPGTDKRSMRSVLEFAIRIWNAIVDEESGGTAGFLAQIRAELGAGRNPSEILDWHDRLVARKRERFSGDLRFVGNWELRQDRGGIHVQMEIRVSPELRAKLEAAGFKA
ncbi:MAG TPA: SEC-C domain-containing protein [Kofleriaceae bacterium]